MSKLRDFARDKPCLVRLPGVCSGRMDTTVLAHYRMAGYSGVGLKPPDILGAWACFECHSCCDRRTHTDLDRDFVRLAHAEGALRTIAHLVMIGKIKL